jgi:glycosyltransferase involved in cell wall biosynthesis
VKSPQVSVLTAAKQPNSTFLLDAYSSLLKQKITWEWLIQIDGKDSKLPDAIADDKRVFIVANGKSYGESITRNMALRRARSDIIQNLDSDDYLLPGALDDMYEHIRTGKYAYVFGRDLSLAQDGTTIDYGGGLKVGVILPGVIYRRWLTIHMTPVHPAGIMWRKDVLFKYGGWHALSSGEDTALMLAASVKHPVFFLDRDTFIYRLHDKQLTSQPGYRKAQEDNWNFIKQRIEALLHDIPLSPL